MSRAFGREMNIKGRDTSASRMTKTSGMTANRMESIMDTEKKIGFLQSLLNSLVSDKVEVGKGRKFKPENTRMAGLKSRAEREAEYALAEDVD